MVITVVTIILSRIPEKLAVVLVGSSYDGNEMGYDSAGGRTFNCKSSIVQTQQVASNDVLHPSWNETTHQDDGLFPSPCTRTCAHEVPNLGWDLLLLG